MPTNAAAIVYPLHSTERQHFTKTTLQEVERSSEQFHKHIESAGY
jgi:hypothetical protein